MESIFDILKNIVIDIITVISTNATRQILNSKSLRSQRDRRY
jgi:hypothetical protein